jgi:hypothetical protein
MRAALLAVLVGWPLGGCAPERPALSSCTESLTGVWTTETGQQWMLLEGKGAQRGQLEGYPLFDDIAGVPGSEVSPRALDLARDAGDVRGEVTRRYMRGSERCDQKAPIVMTACRGTTLQVERREITPPVAFAPCVPGLPGPMRRETWTRH